MSFVTPGQLELESLEHVFLPSSMCMEVLTS